MRIGLFVLVAAVGQVAISFPLLEPIKNTTAREFFIEEKYFHEAGLSIELSHYDSRFFTEEVPYEERGLTLRYLIRSWLSVSRELDLETWLAHGTLLGWWWNGRIMPWDMDLDVQTSGPSADRLARDHNQTLHDYTVAVDSETGAEETRTYMVDVNPYWAELSRNEGENVIDARWIDISNGMYIDITVLLERSPSFAPGVWSCKNFHRYLTRDIYPLREAEFEGIPALVPHRVEKALQAEYGQKSMVDTEFNGYALRCLSLQSLSGRHTDIHARSHRFDSSVKEWVKIE